jgi:hypothetical protein
MARMSDSATLAMNLKHREGVELEPEMPIEEVSILSSHSWCIHQRLWEENLHDSAAW